MSAAPKSTHYLLMTDEAGSRSFAGIECTRTVARQRAQFIADNLDFHVRLETPDEPSECFEPDPNTVRPPCPS